MQKGGHKMKNRSNERGGRNNKPNFLITSSSALNKTIGGIFNSTKQVGDNFQTMPESTPQIVNTQSKQLKNTFQRFKRELREQSESQKQLILESEAAQNNE